MGEFEARQNWGYMGEFGTLHNWGNMDQGVWNRTIIRIGRYKWHKVTQFWEVSWRMCNTFEGQIGIFLLSSISASKTHLTCCRAPRKMTLSFLLAWRLPKLLPSLVSSLPQRQLFIKFNQTEAVNMVFPAQSIIHISIQYHIPEYLFNIVYINHKISKWIKIYSNSAETVSIIVFLFMCCLINQSNHIPIHYHYIIYQCIYPTLLSTLTIANIE